MLDARPLWLHSNLMRAKIVRVGNSRGIRIPKRALEEAGLKDEIELEVKRDRLVLRSAIRPRAGWDEAFAEMARSGDDALLLPPMSTAWDEREWRW